MILLFFSQLNFRTEIENVVRLTKTYNQRNVLTFRISKVTVDLQEEKKT